MADPSAAIYNHFENITDPRVNRGANHSLPEMMFVALTAAICGANSWTNVERFARSKLNWFRQFIDLEHGVPSHDTFGRVFSRLDTGEFLEAMHSWIDSFAGNLRGQGIAIDGKTLRGSFHRAAETTALHTITAFATSTRTVLRQMSVDAKSNEIPAVPQLLNLIELAGAVVTLDAMPCQTETARAIAERDATYLLTVKSNQPTLFAELMNRFDEYANVDFRIDGMRKHVTVERSRGRDEWREYYIKAIDAGDTLFDRWPEARSFGMVYRDRRERDQVQQETVFFITNDPPQVKAISRHLRSHWSIENSQHWVLDVIFAEDASRIRRRKFQNPLRH